MLIIVPLNDKQFYVEIQCIYVLIYEMIILTIWYVLYRPGQRRETNRKNFNSVAVRRHRSRSVSRSRYTRRQVLASTIHLPERNYEAHHRSRSPHSRQDTRRSRERSASTSRSHSGSSHSGESLRSK
jgi:hypothetical protein